MDKAVLHRTFAGINGKKLIWLALAAVLGIILIIFGSLSGSSKTKNTEVSNEDIKTEAYIESVENKIKNITEQITGSRDSCVIVTAKSRVESVYVCDEKTSGDGKAQEYITVKNSDGEGSLVLVKQIYPEISGVSIVCRGGDEMNIQAKLIKAVSTALGIPSNRICIVGTK